MKLLPLLLLAPLTAHAWQFEAGAGTATYSTLANGIWYQEGLPHRMSMSPPAFTAGLTGALYERRNVSLNWHADYVFLGHVHTDAIATTDANYSLASKSCIGPCTSQSRFVGDGNINGFTFTLEPTYKAGNWRFGFEAGAFLFRPTWHETLYVSNNVNVQGQANGQVIHANYRPSWEVRPMVGASVGYGNFSVSYRYFRDGTYFNASNPYPGVWRGTHLLSLMYKF
jgi:hypothetical protein